MPFLPPLGLLVLPLALVLQPALCAEYVSTENTTPHDNEAKCGCYAVNSGADSNTPEYFQYYRFFDFRNLADEPGQFLYAPPEVNDTQDQGDESVWDQYGFNEDAWIADWDIQNWSKPSTEEFPIRTVNSPANVYLLQNDDDDDPFTYLTLRTSRLDEFQSAGEIENLQKNVKHVSMRMYARVTGSKGAVAGFFTFFDDTNETDIEILTDDAPDMVRYTNQPAVDKKGDEVAEASLAPDKLPAWNEWQTHRVDWLPKNSYWYLNDKQVAANTYSVPREPSYLVLNMWSDGGEWSGNMTIGDSAEFQIQWIEMAFNTSGPVEGPEGGDEEKKRSIDGSNGWIGRLGKRQAESGCEVVCKIDGVKTLGTPEVVSLASDVSISYGCLMLVGLVSLVIGL